MKKIILRLIAILKNDNLDHGSKRSRLWALATLSAGGSRVVTMVANLAQVPIALHYLGKEAFGLWMVLIGTIQLMGFADLGMGLGIQNKISEAYAKEDYKLISSIVVTGGLLLAFIGLILAVIGLPLCKLLPWATIFKVTDSTLKLQVAGALTIIFAAFCIGLPLNTASRLAIGIQRGWLVNIWRTAGSVICLLVVFFASQVGIGFKWFILLAVTPPILVNFGISLSLISLIGDKLNLSFKMFHRKHSQQLFSGGFLFLIPQLSASIMSSVPAIMITAVFGPAAVTPFNLCQRFVNSLFQIQQLPIIPLWPAYAEAKGRGDIVWAQKILKKTIIYSSISGVLIALFCGIAGRTLINLWAIGVHIQIGNAMIWGFSIWAFLQCFGSSFITYLNGFSYLKGQVLGGIFSVTVLLIFLPILISKMGSWTAIYIMIFTWLLFDTPFVVWDFLRSMKRYNSVISRV